MSAPTRLHRDDLVALADLVAERVAARIADQPTPPISTLIDAAEVARRFDVSAAWVREHAADLGAVRLGDGPRARLRFDPETAAMALTSRSIRRGSDNENRPRKRGSERHASGEVAGAAGLLPFDTFNSPASDKSGGHRANGPAPATREVASPRTERTRKGVSSVARARAPRTGTDARRRDG